MRSDLCVEHWLLLDSLVKKKSHWIITINGKMNVLECKTDISYWQHFSKDRNNWLKTFLAGENTSVLIILATTVYVDGFIFMRFIVFVTLFSNIWDV